MMASFDPLTTLFVMALKEESGGVFESNNIHPLYTGVGQVRAAYALTRAISEQKPQRIINLGTAGSFSHPQGTCVECSAFIQRQVNPLGLKSKKILAGNEITDLPKAICGTADFIQHSLFENVDSSFSVMDMEAYALAYVSQQYQIPFHSIKFISDHSNEFIFEDWKKNLTVSSELLFSVVKNLFI